MESKLKKIKQTIYNLAIKNKAVFALLFESYTRGTETEHSDLDVIFVEETDKPFLKRLDPYFSPLSDLMNGGVDVFVYTPDEFIKMQKGFFIQRAMKEGVVIPADLTPSEVYTEEEASKAVESSTIILEQIKKILQNQLRFSYENNKI